MHEVSIAQSMLDIAVRECGDKGYSSIDSIRVRIGRASGVMPDALLFAFNAVKLDTIADKASLIIDEIPVSGLCRSCNTQFSVDERFVIACPHCGGNAFVFTGGRELEITEMEVS